MPDRRSGKDKINAKLRQGENRCPKCKKLLFEEGHISQEAFDQSQKQFTEMEVNYQQILLSILFENQYVTIDNFPGSRPPPHPIMGFRQ